MCIICQRASDQWFKAYNQGLIKLDTLEARADRITINARN